MNERSIFMEALDQDTLAGRSTYLDEACGGDAVLRQRVEALLASHEQAGSFLKMPIPERLAEKLATPQRAAEMQAEKAGAAEKPSLAPCQLPTVADEPAITERPGTQIGHYKLLQQIGEGGMGIVFMAEQTHPVQRKVALKVIKPGMDSRQVVARFEAERQALAMMDHVNIARVLDAGATESGRPYFVMELVHGVPITKYCDDNHQTPRERLELFVPVCQALQHAHQKGIIHRDVKPSNVMVTLYDGKPVPKVIDFGVAKATEQRLTERTLFTQYGTMVGTPEYMSPEQAEMSALGVDTRSDIYSLGVLLYELLTGSTPLSHERVREAGYGEILRMIKEEEPPKPSTRLSDSGEALASISAQRQMEPAKLTHLVRGELDWIAMKALEKDRTRRYDTASSFAADVLRHLADQPVEACPPSASYRLRKLIRRNRTAVTVGMLVTVLLIVGTAVSTWLAFWATTAEQLAQKRLQSETTERERAVKAESRATQRLYDSLFAQAQASQWSGRAGQRLKSLKALTEAARIVASLNRGSEELREEVLKLRNEAIAAMTLIDLKLAREWNALPGIKQLRAVAFDGDLRRYAFADDEGNASVRTCADASELFRLPGFHAQDYVMQFSPDGQLLAVASPHKNILRFWDLKREETRISAPFNPAGGTLAFRPGGRQVAVTAPDGSLRLLDLAKGDEVKRLSPGLAPSTISFHPSGKWLALGRWNGLQALIVDVDTGQVETRLDVKNVWAVAWHPDGRLLATASADRILLWEPENDSEKPRAVLEGHQSTVTHLAFDHTGQLLASNGFDTTLRIWDPWLARQLVSIPGVGGQFSQDGRRLVCQNDRDRLSILKLVRSEECGHFRARARDLEFSPDGRLAATPDSDGVHLLDVAARREVAFLATGKSNSVWFDRATNDLLTLGEAGLYRWPVTPRDGDLSGLIVGPPQTLVLPDIPPGLGWATAGRDGRILVVRDGGHGRAVVLHVDQPGQRVVLQGPTNSFFDTAISPDGRWVADAPWDGQGVRVWNSETGKLFLQLPGTESVNRARVTFSPDGQWLASGGDYEFRLWKVGSWEPGLCIRQGGPGNLPRGVAFSPDSAVLAIVYSQRLVKLIDVLTGTELATLPTQHLEMQSDLSFSPDGTQLVVDDERKPIHVWDLRRVRERLADMGLDWDQPAYPPTPPGEVKPLRVEVHETAYNDLGVALAVQGKLNEAIAFYKKAIELDPNFALAHYNLGVGLRAQGKLDEAVAAFQKAIRLGLPPESNGILGLAGALHWQGKTTEACRLVEQDIADLRAVQSDPNNAVHWRLLRDRYVFLADNAPFAPDELAKLAEEFPRILPDEQDECVRAAWYLCRCVSQVVKDDKLPLDERAKLAECYADRAVEMVRQSIAKGNKDANRLETDSAFAPLRSREDFQQLVAELEAKNK